MSRDGARERGGYPVRLGEFMAGNIERIGPKGLWKEARLRKAWGEAVGAEVSLHAQVGRLRGTTLEVFVDSEAWGTQLRYLSAVVIEKLNRALGAGAVSEIVVRRARRSRS